VSRCSAAERDIPVQAELEAACDLQPQYFVHGATFDGQFYQPHGQRSSKDIAAYGAQDQAGRRAHRGGMAKATLPSWRSTGRRAGFAIQNNCTASIVCTPQTLVDVVLQLLAAGHTQSASEVTSGKIMHAPASRDANSRSMQARPFVTAGRHTKCTTDGGAIPQWTGVPRKLALNSARSCDALRCQDATWRRAEPGIV
jgi:hypothetical protein